MDIRRWSGCGSGKDMIRLGRPVREDEVGVQSLTRWGCCPSRRSCWRAAWNRLLRERRRIFGSRVQTQRRLLQRRPYYDATSYARNFDEGRLWDDDERDNMSRSFSMRFADPSRVQFLNREVRLLDL